jgi:hypothetical protein
MADLVDAQRGWSRRDQTSTVFAAIFRPAAAPQEPFRIDCDLELSERNDMTNDKTISIGWLLAGVLTVTIVFNGIALALG